LGLLVLLNLRHGAKVASWRDQLVLLLPGILIFIIVSCENGFSEHTRYVLPAFPYFFVLVAQGAGLSGRLRIITAILLSWFVTSSLCIYPHSLSYFNEVVGGPLRGHEHLLGSNVDWGQDLLYVRQWCGMHPDSNLHLAYHGPFNPICIDIEAPDGGPTRKRVMPGAGDPCAISANVLFGDESAVGSAAATGRYSPKDMDLLRFRQTAPRRMFGYSIYYFDP
jgi:hypothetical protein